MKSDLTVIETMTMLAKIRDDFCFVCRVSE